MRSAYNVVSVNKNEKKHQNNYFMFFSSFLILGRGRGRGLKRPMEGAGRGQGRGQPQTRGRGQGRGLTMQRGRGGFQQHGGKRQKQSFGSGSNYIGEV